MTQAPAPRIRVAPLVRPWTLLFVGLGLVVFSLLLSSTDLYAVRVILAGIGLVFAGFAVSRRLQTAGAELEERVESAGLLALASVAALLALLGMDKKWDSALMFLGVLTGVGLAGSVLVLLPSLGRRIVLSVMVVYHFGCIVTAVTLVPPRNEPAPWLSMQLYGRVYRPYMAFMYLTNAYHFYSPDPGPANLLWFHVEYADGSARWIKLPYRSDFKINLHYQRMLALTEFASNQGPLPLNEEHAIVWSKRMKGRPYTHDPWETIYRRRNALANRVPELQMVRDVTTEGQYSEPSEESKHFISSYARHVARTSPHPDNPDISVKTIRIYRVVHNIIRPKELVEGHRANEETYYWPFYVGQFDTEGNLLDRTDPCLYWLLPIAHVSDGFPRDGTPLRINDQPRNTDRVINCVEIHANLRRSSED
jgi:hypothetical protein